MIGVGSESVRYVKKTKPSRDIRFTGSAASCGRPSDVSSSSSQYLVHRVFGVEVGVIILGRVTTQAGDAVGQPQSSGQGTQYQRYPVDVDGRHNV